MDPIVASFCGGGVGVLTALLIVEANNAKMQVGGRAPGAGRRALVARVAERSVLWRGTRGLLHCMVGAAATDGTPPCCARMRAQEKRRCIYCEGTGYLTCGTCVGSGMGGAGEACANCAGTGKVMCTSCLCTGKKLATEHDPRVDPFTLGME